MSPRVDPVLRFPFSASDQARIDVNSIQVEDTLVQRPSESPDGFGMALTFHVTDPAAGPMRLRALGPGRLTFIADVSVDPLPPADVLVDASTYWQFPTRGVLCVDLLPPSAEEINRSLQPFEVVPTRIWYGPVDIPLDFLEQTLTVRKNKLPGGSGFPTVLPSNSDWWKHAAARFLSGIYTPEIRLGTSQADDDVAVHPMPFAVLGADPAKPAEVSLEIVCGRATPPTDGATTLFAQAPGSLLDSRLPGHPSGGCIPARAFFRSIRTGLIGGGAGLPLADAMLDSSRGRKFRVIKVTRSWQPVDECSVYFPRHEIVIDDPAGNEVWRQWIPTHGVVFVPDDPTQPLGQAQVRFEAGPMRWLLADAGSSAVPAWRRLGTTTPIAVNLASEPHLIARLPMTMAMQIERPPVSAGGSCTYMSLRRTMRALADNRICGGRLNFFRRGNPRRARGLLQAAWGSDVSFIPQSDANRAWDPVTEQTVDLRFNPDLLLAFGRPLPIKEESEIAQRNVRLRFALRLFFPDPAPQYSVPGATVATVLTQGEVYSHLWQSFVDAFHDADRRANFHSDHIMRGAPGAMVAAGLASFVGPIDRQSGESNTAFSHRLVNQMLGDASNPPRPLESGALIQFWSRASDYEALRSRPMAPNNGQHWALPGTLSTDPGHVDNSYGHSPVFVNYTGNSSSTVLRVVDQTGRKAVTLQGTATARRLKWGWFPGGEEIWIAANWTE